MRALIIALFTNVVTYCVARLFFRRTVTVGNVVTGSATEEAVYMLCGCQGRTSGDETFQLLIDTLKAEYPKVTIFTLEYRNRGVDVEQASKYIVRHIKGFDFRRVTFVTASVGCSIAASTCANLLGGPVKTGIFALTPCWGRDSLAQNTKRAITLLPIGYWAAHVLGWALLLPAVKSNGRPYSLQLLLDQFRICSRKGHPRHPPECRITEVLCSEDTVVSSSGSCETLLLWGEPHFGTGGVWQDPDGENWNTVLSALRKMMGDG